MNHWDPILFENRNLVPKSPDPDYHMTEDIADKAIAWTRKVTSIAPDHPFFLYVAPGANHSPHQAPKEWIEKFKGQFDDGWDAYRETTITRQKKLGVVPDDAELTVRSEGLPAWGGLNDGQKKVYARMMEVFAGYAAHVDHHMGRIIDAVKQMPGADNTIFIYIVGDNGASAEGGLEGTFSEIASLIGIQLVLESMIKRIDEIGGPKSEPHVPVGWAWAMDAPFKWTKQVASHFGGTRNPMVVHWPNGIKAKGEIRPQFHHVIDVVPTILEAAKIPEPASVNGIAQKPMEGVSMLYSFEDANARGRRTTQYFELATNRAIYHDGWIACSQHGLPWETAGHDDGFLTAPWELYNIDEDFSEADDLAASNPEKLKELRSLFLEEAKKYGVFPLDPRFAERMDPKLRESGEPRTSWTYHGNHVWLPEPIGPQIFPRGHSITAELTIPDGGAEGVVTCAGSFSAGWSLYIKDKKPVFRYQAFEIADANVFGDVEIPVGKVVLKTEFIPDPESQAGGGTLKLFVNGKPAGEGKLARTFFRHGLEPFEVGRDSITPIDPAYKDRGTFAFTGGIDTVKFDLTKQ